MKTKTLYKYVVLGFISGFMLSLLGAMYEHYKHNITFILALSQFHHFIAPLILGSISGFLGFLYWKRKANQAAANNNYAKNLHSLLDINTALLSSIELTQVLQIIIDEATHLTNLDTGAIYLHEDEKLYLGATTPPLPLEFPEALRYDLLVNHPNIQKSLLENQSVIIPDTDLATLSEAEKTVVKYRGLRSIIYIPLIIENHPVGTLILGTTNNLRTFSEQEIDMYRLFSGQAALTIENAHLYKKSIQAAQQLRLQNEEYLTLNEELQQTNEELYIAKEKAEESKVIIHEQLRELQSTEEEIRANNEELMATTDALKESYLELQIAKEKAEENENRFKSLFQNMNNSASHYEVIYNNEGIPVDYRFLDVNKFYEKSLGLKAIELIGKTLLEVFPETEQLWLDAFKEVVLTSKPIIMESYSKAVDMYFELIVYVPQKGKIALIGSDISERKKTEKDLILAKEKAEESNQLKSAFLENISHEIRTPMNSIIGFSNLLLNTDITDEKHKQFTDLLQKATHQLLTVVDNTITLSQIETNQLQINKIDFPPSVLLANLLTEYNSKKQLIGKSHIGLHVNELQSIDIQIRNDYSRINEIFSILLDNAFKFTDKGTVEIGYTLGINKINFFVKDTGIGIPTEKQQLIFKSFTQADKNIRQLFGGLGVGLSIAMGLVSILNGEIVINSAINAGTEVIFSLPMADKNK